MQPAEISGLSDAAEGLAALKLISLENIWHGNEEGKGSCGVQMFLCRPIT